MARCVRNSLLFGVLLAANSLAFAPAPVYREPRVPDFYSLMQGTWEVEQQIHEIRPRRIVRVTRTIRIKGTSWVSDRGSPFIGGSSRYRIVLDPKTKPASFDLVEDHRHLLPPNAIGLMMDEKPVMKGIVQIDRDTLTFCHVYSDQKNADRPKHFIAGEEVTTDGTAVRSITLKRVE